MATSVDAQSAEKKARELLDNRIESVRALVRSRQALADAQARVAEAEKADVATYRAAVRDGWTEDELRKLGIDEPEKKQRTKRRATARRSTSSSAPTDAATSPAPPAPTS